MWYRTIGVVVVVAMLALIARPSRARADTTLSDFNGTGFDYVFGTWPSNVVTGPSFVTVAGTADQFGGGGVLLGTPRNLTGSGIALRAQRSPTNVATEIRVVLVDINDNRAVFVFSTSGFSTSIMTTVNLATSTFTLGGVDMSNIVRFEVTGSFADTDTPLAMMFDSVVATSPQADLAITKTDGVTIATPSGSLTYTITASNVGPSNAPGATVTDILPSSLTATWTCVGAGGGTCTAAGSGNINDTVNLPAGGSVTYTVSATISAAATGTLSNKATVAAPGGVTDPNPDNNSATDTDSLSASPPMFAKIFTPATITLGATSTLRFDLTNPNLGIALSAVGFTDMLPLGIEVHSSPSVMNTCGGMVTAAAGTQLISLSGGALPVGGACYVQVQVRGTLSGVRTNTTGAVSSTESGAGGTATATLTITAPTGAGITVTGDNTPVTLPVSTAPLSFTFVAANNTAAPLTGTTMQITLPAGVQYQSVSFRRGGVTVPANPTTGPNCISSAPSRLACNLGTLPPGDALTIVVTATRQSAPPYAQLCANALLSGSAPGLQYATGTSCARQAPVIIG